MMALSKMKVRYPPGESNPSTISHAVAEDFARQYGASHKDGSEFLYSHERSEGQRGHILLTTSVSVLGRFEMYRLVDPSSPSALRRELKDSYSDLLERYQKRSRQISLTLAKPTS